MVDVPDSRIFSGKRILVVDDSAENLSMIEAILESSDYQVELAENGSVALGKIRLCCKELR